MEADVKVKYEKEIMYIKNYIGLNPGQPKCFVSAKTHVSPEIIDELIAEGIIKEEGGVLKLVTRQNIKGKEREDLLIRLKESVIEDKYKNAGRSRLLDDLERRNRTNRHETDGR